jgi:hypothetical protein
MTTAWITSFSKDLYLATGGGLLNSFLAINNCGKLHVYAEGLELKTEDPRVVIESDPSLYPELSSFIKANSDIIHKEFGGSWEGPCRCPNPNDSKDKRHKSGCPNSWFCKHAIRWFRKVLSVSNFVDKYPEFDRFVWLDSDVVFNAPVSEDSVTSWFNDKDVFFLKGPKRKVWETGVFGVRGPRGKSFIVKTLDYFMSNRFRVQPRWDDGFIFQFIAESDPELLKVDLATDASGHADVVPHSPVGNFLTHNKGTHGRGMGIMK